MVLEVYQNKQTRTFLLTLPFSNDKVAFPNAVVKLNKLKLLTDEITREHTLNKRSLELEEFDKLSESVCLTIGKGKRARLFIMDKVTLDSDYHYIKNLDTNSCLFSHMKCDEFAHNICSICIEYDKMLLV